MPIKVVAGERDIEAGSKRLSIDKINVVKFDNSGSGDAIVDLKGNKLEGKLVMTAKKKNGEIKAPFTFDKTETIDDESSNERIWKTVQLCSSTVEVKIGTGSGTAEVRK